MLIIETVHIYYGHTCPTKQLEIEKHGKLPVLIKNSYLAFVSFCFGAVIEHLTTDIGKYGVGRLRPHFFSVCHLNMSMIDCRKGYIEDYECTGDADQIREVRLVGILRPSPCRPRWLSLMHVQLVIGRSWVRPRTGPATEIFSMVILPLLLIHEGQLSVSDKKECTQMVNRLENYVCSGKVWLSELTTLDMTLVGWLGQLR